MTERCDAIVIGAGPAGAEAAIVAARHGRRVVLIDEQPAAGGQVWRAPVGGFAGKGDADQRVGDDLRERLAAATATTRFGRRVWSVVGPGAGRETGFRVDALGTQGNESFEAPALVVATGAHERVTPFPGWTLPGVIGLAAATVLLKSHGAAPGGRVVVAGCGPLLAVVAAGLVAAGVEVAAIVDRAARRDWAKHLPALLGRPSLALRGATLVARARLAGAPFYAAHGVRRAEGDEAVRRVVIGPVDAQGAPAAGAERAFDCDALVVGHGLTTACEITRLMRAEHRYDRLRGGWIPVVDQAFRTSVEGLYAIGDGAGLRGQIMATLAGRRAGLAIAAGGGADATAELAEIDRALRRAAPFSDAMASLMAQRPAEVAAIAADTVVCRCEDVTRGEIDAAITDGARDIDQLKHFTRCGMGPCQGRSCGDTVEELTAGALNVSRETIGRWTGRPPLRPVALGEMIGAFDYADIPIPTPAPL